MKPVRILHVDLTAFFVSVERLINPDLVGKPIMVAGSADSRGVVTCASYEVRAYGIKAGMPTALAERKCPHAIRIDAHYEAYSEYSNKVQAFLKNYAPVFEAAGLDEFYLDWTGCEKLFGGDLYRFALRVQKTIRTKIGLPCSLGIATNKIAAKVACDQAKPDRVIEILPGAEALYLKPLSVGVLCGVGDVMREKLNLRGIRTCGHLAELDSEYVGQAFGKVGLNIQRYAKGFGDDFLTVAREQKQISRSETFSSDTRDEHFLNNRMHEMTLDISEELRALGLKSRCVQVTLRYSDWVEYSRQISVSPTDDPASIYQIGLGLLKKADTRRVTIRLIGIGVSKFTEDAFTIDCFRQNEERREWLLKAVDKVNHKYKSTVVKIGLVA